MMGPFSQTQTAAQGYIKAFYVVDIAIKKNFLKNNAASATLSFSDIFRTRKQQQHSESEYLYRMLVAYVILKWFVSTLRIVSVKWTCRFSNVRT
jgi:hypothetical protein